VAVASPVSHSLVLVAILPSNKPHDKLRERSIFSYRAKDCGIVLY